MCFSLDIFFAAFDFNGMPKSDVRCSTYVKEICCLGKGITMISIAASARYLWTVKQVGCTYTC